jgi:hypothetical protein
MDETGNKTSERRGNLNTILLAVTLCVLGWTARTTQESATDIAVLKVSNMPREEIESKFEQVQKDIVAVQLAQTRFDLRLQQIIAEQQIK